MTNYGNFYNDLQKSEYNTQLITNKLSYTIQKIISAYTHKKKSQQVSIMAIKGTINTKLVHLDLKWE
jgi:hypothetical protein